MQLRTLSVETDGTRYGVVRKSDGQDLTSAGSVSLDSDVRSVRS